MIQYALRLLAGETKESQDVYYRSTKYSCLGVALLVSVEPRSPPPPLFPRDGGGVGD